jgi:FlaA1/EpsC-like NDP-sugar epimerase
MNYLKFHLNQNLFLLLIGDCLLILTSFYFSILFRFDFSFPDELISLVSFKNLIGLTVLKIFWFRIFALYRGMWRYTSVWDMINIIKGNVAATFFLCISVFYFIGFQDFSRSLFVIDFIVCTGLICISRLGVRMFFSHIRNILLVKSPNYNKNNIILIGAGHTGQLIVSQIFHKHDSDISVIGFLDDDKTKIGRRLHDVPVIGTVDSISSFKNDFDEIYICIPSANRDQMKRIIECCTKTKKAFKMLPSLSGLLKGNISLSQFREVSYLDLLGREEIKLDKGSINNLIKGKRVLVTGAGGSIGSELVRQCINFKPSLLIMIDISELNLFEIEREVIKNDSNILFKPILSDIRDYSMVDQLFSEFRPQIVFHAAAYKHVTMQENFPWEAVKTNVFGTTNISDISVKYDVEKFVLVSTDKAVKPVNVMGATKRLAEMITLDYNRSNKNTDFIAVRFGNVLGSSGSVIPIFQEQIKNGGPLTVTDPDMKRFFMSIPEASQLILQAGSLGMSGEIFILDMGEPIKIIDIAKELIRLSGYEPGLDISIEFTGKRPGEKQIEELSLPSEILDKTKFDKIFVLNNPLVNKKILSDIKKLENYLLGKSANQVRLILSSILPEYEPSLESENSSYLKVKADAEA